MPTDLAISRARDSALASRGSFAVVFESKGLSSGSTSELPWIRHHVSEPVSSSIKGNNNPFTQLFEGLKEITHQTLVVGPAESYY